VKPWTAGVGDLLGARAAGIENLDAEDARLLGNAVCLGANGARNVGAVAVAIAVLAVTGEVLEELGAALKLLFMLSVTGRWTWWAS
jgi:hypothetical protein